MSQRKNNSSRRQGRGRGRRQVNGNVAVDGEPRYTRPVSDRDGDKGEGNGNEDDGDRQAAPRRDGPMLSLFDLQKKTVPELCEFADAQGLVDLGALQKHELIFEIINEHAHQGGCDCNPLALSSICAIFIGM